MLSSCRRLKIRDEPQISWDVNFTDKSQIIKVLAYIVTCDDNRKHPVLVSIRGDQEVNEIKLSNELSQKLNLNVLLGSKTAPHVP